MNVVILVHGQIQKCLGKIILENQFRPLGDLNFFRVWHDNSGIGDYASWFLSGVVIKVRFILF